MILVREISCNMTSGGGGDEDIERGLRKFLDTRKGGSEKIKGAPKICILQNQQMGGRGLLKIEPLARGGGG